VIEPRQRPRQMLSLRPPGPSAAEVAKSALTAYEIESSIQRGPYRHLAMTFDLVVRKEDADTANEILGPDEQFSD
jgi:hypothetical protein